MKVTKVKVTEWKKGNTLGFASVELDDVLTITDIVIRNGEYGKFVKFPEKKGSDGNYFPVVYVKNDLKKVITEKILEKMD